MTLIFQEWMRAVWLSLIEPAAMARRVLDRQIDMQSLWIATALIAVLNVLFLALMQFLSPVPVAMQSQAIALSPFGLTAMLGTILVLLVFSTYYVGQMLDGAGTLYQTLLILTWFHAVSLTLEAIQILVIFISPLLGTLYGMVTVVGLIWCFINFINELHKFDSLMKSLVALVLALIGMAITGGVLMALLGVTPAGGTV